RPVSLLFQFPCASTITPLSLHDALPILREYLYADEPLIRAVVRMNALGTRHLPVVTPGEPRLVGLVTMSDIFRAQALAAEAVARSEEHTSELQSRENLVCRLLLEKKKDK